MERPEYERPRLQWLGSVRTLTMASSIGSRCDGATTGSHRRWSGQPNAGGLRPPTCAD
jgi:hypothetical protein